MKFLFIENFYFNKTKGVAVLRFANSYTNFISYHFQYLNNLETKATFLKI